MRKPKIITAGGIRTMIVDGEEWTNAQDLMKLFKSIAAKAGKDSFSEMGRWAKINQAASLLRGCLGKKEGI